MGATWSQLFPPAPILTEKNLPAQTGKVFIVTGAASGIGYELAKLLYGAGGKVYVAGRSEENARQSIEYIKNSSPDAPGQLEFLFIDLADLSTVKDFVQDFEARETRLDILFNNAAVSLAEGFSKQGHNLQHATNCLGPFLLTQLLSPALRRTAQDAPPGSVRVVWSSSQIVDLSAPKGGFPMTTFTSPPNDLQTHYTASKTGNWFLASEFARRNPQSGILSVTQNPGNLSTQLLRHAPVMRFFSSPLLHPPKMGAYTELWAGLSPELNLEEHGGVYIVPWGRLHPAPRADLLGALKSREEGGSGRASEFWDWCEGQTKDFI
ncbi:MAG: hypothetical protein M1821_009284 [Bathelium mastoideum]|nr:MAG: hypothetical protein M1821_009284 [Bathelium mastoideum]